MTEHASNTPVGLRDLWSTPGRIFDRLHSEFGFVLDVAASIRNRKVPAFFSKEMDSLSQPWPPVPCWCNPPYSDIGPWIGKAIEAARYGTTTVMLVPSDTSVAWFDRAWRAANEVRFINGRISFISAETGRSVSGNNKGSVLIIFRPEGQPTGGPTVSLIRRDALL